MTDIEICFNCREQGGQNYSCKEIEKEDPGQIEKGWEMRPKRRHRLILLFGDVSVPTRLLKFTETNQS